ncbi:MAG: TIGR02302 family protein, partial [Alphaproteobacteria bacterium]|nr:TIGR02302 family protein [Alphaproteobacteria bacterium]
MIPLPPGRLALAWAALLWERLWPALWPLVGVAVLFASLAFLDVLPDLPFWTHILILAAFVAALGWGAWAAFRDIAAPDRLAARRRLERDNQLDHRPLAALEDTLVSGKADPFAEALWKEHRRRLLDRLRRLKVALPSPGSARRDPLALRVPLVLLLIAALAAGWGDFLPRLERAVVPTPGSGGPAEIQALELWITPPEYTGLPPIFLRAGDVKPEGAKAASAATQPAPKPGAKNEEATVLRAPAGSKLLAQVHGRLGAPRLKLGDSEQAFAPVDESTHRLEMVLEKGGRMSVEAGRRSFGAWTLDVVPDKPPTVVFAQAPQRTQRSALRLEYDAKDDYGVAGVKATIRLLGEDEAVKAGEDPIELELPLPGLRLKQAKAASYHDLTAHVWAGLKVEMQLTATDEPGQTGESEKLTMVLPERVFNHPVARAIVEQRRLLSLAPEKRREVAAALFALAQRPQLFFDDLVVFLGLKTAQARLMRDRTPEGTRAVQALMWDTALRVEDGKISIAERELREAERRLMDALNKNASDPEIEKLINELQQALDQYLQAMMEQMRRQMEMGMQPQPMDPNARMIDSRELQKMIEQARDLARSGNRDAAKQLLSQLREMLENMRQGMMSQMSPQQQQAMQMMQGLQDMIKRQRELMDQTFRDAQQQGKLP